MTLIHFPRIFRLVRYVCTIVLAFVLFSLPTAGLLFGFLFFSILAIIVYIEFIFSYLKIPKKYSVKFYGDGLELYLHGEKTRILFTEFSNTSIKIPTDTSFSLFEFYYKLALGIFPQVILSFEYKSEKIQRRLIIGNESEHKRLLKILEKNFN